MEEKIIAASRKFWDAMEHANEVGMREVADKDCMFVHIGVTCGLDQEIGYYTSKKFEPTGVDFHSQNVTIHGDTAVVITDCDYSFLLEGKETTHHFAVTEVFVKKDGDWKLIQFSFTALVYHSRG